MRLRRKRWSKMEVEHVGADIIRPLCRHPPHFAGAQCAPLQRSLRERYAGAGREKKSPVPPAQGFSFNYGVQSLEQWVVEKLSQADSQPVAELLDGHDTGVFALCVQHAVNGGRRYPAEVCKGVHRHIPL